MSLEKFRAYGEAAGAYVREHLDPKYLSLNPGTANGWDPDRAMWEERGREEARLLNEWRGTLPPAQRAEFDAMQKFSDEQNKRHFNTGFKAAAGAVALGGLAMGAGALGLIGAPSGAAGAAGAAVPESVAAGLDAADALMATGLPASTGVPAATAAGLDAADALMATGLPASTAAGGGAGGGLLSTLTGAASKVGDLFGWGNALLGAGTVAGVIGAMTADNDMPAGNEQLLQAQLRSMGYQEDAAKEVMRLAADMRGQMGELLPAQKEALQLALDSGRTAYAQSQADREYQLGQRAKFDAQANAISGEADAFNTPAAERQRAEAAAAGVGKAYADATAATDRTLAAQGIAPGSGRQMAIREAAGVDLARAQVGAANDARLAARNEGRMLRDRALATVAGAPSAASALTNQGALIGTNQVNNANAGASGIYGGYGALTGQQQAAAGIGGMLGGNATSMYGAQNSRDLAATAAKNASNENLWGGIGTLLGGATKWFQTKP